MEVSQIWVIKFSWIHLHYVKPNIFVEVTILNFMWTYIPKKMIFLENTPVLVIFSKVGDL